MTSSFIITRTTIRAVRSGRGSLLSPSGRVMSSHTYIHWVYSIRSSLIMFYAVTLYSDNPATVLQSHQKSRHPADTAEKGIVQQDQNRTPPLDLVHSHHQVTIYISFWHCTPKIGMTKRMLITRQEWYNTSHVRKLPMAGRLVDAADSLLLLECHKDASIYRGLHFHDWQWELAFLY